MKTQRLLIALTLVNFALLALTVVAMRPTVAQGAQDVSPVLRGRALEIVDDHGRVRASIGVLPAGVSAKGDRYAETVLFRLSTERGRPSVKISASEEGSGLSFAGTSGTSDTYVILEAKGSDTQLKMRNEAGREQVLKP